MQRRQWLVNVGAAGLAAGTTGWASAQAVGAGTPAASAVPAGALQLVVPVPPGGSVDLTARLLADHLPRLLGQSVVVENRPGASGSIAAASVARAAADPNQLMLVFDSFVTNPLIYPTVSYGQRDFTPISRLLSFPLVFAVPATLPVNSVQEFIALARKKPGALNVSSAGLGTLNHLAAELFKARTGTHIVHIPYRGGVPALQAVMNDEAQLFLGSWVAIGPHVKSGRIKALAVTSARRYAVAPDLPTLAEAGVPDFDVSTWIGAVAPARITPERREVLHDSVIQAMAGAAVRQTLAQQGLEWVGSSGAEFESFIVTETRRWTELVAQQKLSFG
jgi:tripartite-type tricarboxylate transporter receptor subunit TctC